MSGSENDTLRVWQCLTFLSPYVSFASSTSSVLPGR
jgi:hypothetical protein